MTNPLQTVAADLDSIRCLPVTDHDRSKARLYVEAHATDEPDLALLLSMLGLLPGQEF